MSGLCLFVDWVVRTQLSYTIEILVSPAEVVNSRFHDMGVLVNRDSVVVYDPARDRLQTGSHIPVDDPELTPVCSSFKAFYLLFLATRAFTISELALVTVTYLPLTPSVLAPTPIVDPDMIVRLGASRSCCDITMVRTHEVVTPEQ